MQHPIEMQITLSLKPLYDEEITAVFEDVLTILKDRGKSYDTLKPFWHRFSNDLTYAHELAKKADRALSESHAHVFTGEPFDEDNVLDLIAYAAFWLADRRMRTRNPEQVAAALSLEAIFPAPKIVAAIRPYDTVVFIGRIDLPTTKQSVRESLQYCRQLFPNVYMPEYPKTPAQEQFEVQNKIALEAIGAAFYGVPTDGISTETSDKLLIKCLKENIPVVFWGNIPAKMIAANGFEREIETADVLPEGVNVDVLREHMRRNNIVVIEKNGANAGSNRPEIEEEEVSE